MKSDLRSMPSWRSLLAAFGAVALICLAAGRSQGAGHEAKVDYNHDIRPILSRSCFACHGSDESHRARELRLDLRATATRELPSGATAIVPGSPDESEVIARLTEEDE